MPFTEPKDRERINRLGVGACENVGDICFVFYSQIMKVWRREPRWRTAHRLFKDYAKQPEACEFVIYVYDQLVNKFELEDVVCAAELAYKVFWDFYVLPYEREKQKSNGDI